MYTNIHSSFISLFVLQQMTSLQMAHISLESLLTIGSPLILFSDSSTPSDKELKKIILFSPQELPKTTLSKLSK